MPPYKHPPALKELLAQADAARKAARGAAREAASKRAPLAEARRRLIDNLARVNKARERMRGWEQWDDRAAERINGQRWRDNTARIADLTSQLLDADIALAMFDAENPT